MTNLSEEGFLSDEVAAVIHTIRAKYSSWFAELRVLNELLVRAQYELEIHKQSAQETVCAALYIRALTHSQAAVILIERGMVASAKAMARCALEALFKLGACACEPKRALELLNENEVDKMRLAKRLAEVQDPEIQKTVAEHNLKRIITDTQQKIAELDAREIKIREMAKLADLEDIYLTTYVYLCGAVHSSALDLDEHFEVDDTGSPRALVNEPIVEGLDKLCLMIGETMVACNRALARVFQLETSKCEQSLERLQNLWKQTG